MEHTDLYINGEWREGADKTRFDVLNPATEEVLASVASAEIADADAALALSRVVGHVRANLDRKVSVDEMATVAGGQLAV